MPDDGLQTRGFRDAAEWEAWLEEHHQTARGVWVLLAKKGSGIESVAYEQAVEGALCFGWIDGLTRGRDERTYVQRYTPRRPRSSWSESNRARARALVESGRMRPAGLRALERAEAEGLREPAAPSASDVQRREQ